MKHPERRREPRVPSVNLVNVMESDDEGRLASLTTGRTLDLSHGGARIEVSRSAEPQARLRLRMALANHVVDASGHVCYAQELEDGTYALGVRLADVSPEAYEALHTHLLGRRAS